MIRITSRQDGFRRCGTVFPKGVTEYPDKTFSRDQLTILQAEPMLTVEVQKPSDKSDQSDRPEDIKRKK